VIRAVKWRDLLLGIGVSAETSTTCRDRVQQSTSTRAVDSTLRLPRGYPRPPPDRRQRAGVDGVWARADQHKRERQISLSQFSGIHDRSSGSCEGDGARLCEDRSGQGRARRTDRRFQTLVPDSDQTKALAGATDECTKTQPAACSSDYRPPGITPGRLSRRQRDRRPGNPQYRLELGANDPRKRRANAERRSNLPFGN
jgi:hypothetical protein